MGRIPERWKEYSSCGKPIKDVPIFTFKTPLAKKYSTQHDPTQEFVEEEEEFTPSEVVKFAQNLQYEVVVILDLTNTYRYYNGIEEFGKRFGIQYEKVKCEGQKIPNSLVMQRVADVVNDVMHRHGRQSNKLVGIHCTHGVNRTGYLVARYMIEWLAYEPKDAIELVNKARGHDMEREAYLEDLLERTPGDRFAEWEKTMKMVETVNGTGGKMNLWTGFGEENMEAERLEVEDSIDKSIHQPYPRMFPGDHRQHHSYHWHGFPPRSHPYTERRFPASNKHQ